VCDSSSKEARYRYYELTIVSYSAVPHGHHTVLTEVLTSLMKRGAGFWTTKADRAFVPPIGTTNDDVVAARSSRISVWEEANMVIKCR
jgi:hypothetical protein